jgi:hypothetical protein
VFFEIKQILCCILCHWVVLDVHVLG